MSPVRTPSPSMKLHHFARGFRDHEPASLTLACKRLRPLAPAPASTSTSASSAFDLKRFIRPESGPRKHGSSEYQNKESTQVVEVAAGGTRWNPAQEQIGILEMLYQGGMRTPNAQQIEHITAQLAKYGKIEGKNVFYWFQNHKARERQKQKRTTLGLSPSPTSQPPPSPFTLLSTGEESDCSSQKRKLRSWCAEVDNRYCEKEGEAGDRTLELFPLHPEGRSG